MFHSWQTFLCDCPLLTRPTNSTCTCGCDLTCLSASKGYCYIHTRNVVRWRGNKPQTLNYKAGDYVQITPLTRRTARHFTYPFKTIVCLRTPPTMVLYWEEWHLHPRLKNRSNEWPQKLRDFPWAFYQNCTWKSGGICLSSSPSPQFLITPTSNKEATLKEFISVFQIKTQTATVQTVTKWIVQRRHPKGTVRRPQHR
jgi:hypothetical protein